MKFKFQKLKNLDFKIIILFEIGTLRFEIKKP